MSAGEAILLLSWPIDLELTVGSHGWAHLAPWSWDPEAGRLRRPERIGDELGIIEIAQSGPDSIIWDGFALAQAPPKSKDAHALGSPPIGSPLRRWARHRPNVWASTI